MFLADVTPTFVKRSSASSTLEDATLKSRIAAFMERPAKCVFRMDGSKGSSHGETFFTGFGPSKWIVLFDAPSVTPQIRVLRNPRSAA